MIATWIAGGVLGCAAAIFLLAFAFGRDPFGLFVVEPNVATTTVETEQSDDDASATTAKVTPEEERSASPNEGGTEQAAQAVETPANDVSAKPPASDVEQGPPPAVQNRLMAVPTAEELTTALERLDEGLKSEISGAVTPEQGLALSYRLFVQAIAYSKDPAVRFFLLEKAQELAVAAGNLDTARRTCFELKRLYELDPLKVDAALLSGLAETAKSDVDLRQIVSDSLGLADELMLANRFKEADRSIETAEGLVARLSDEGLRRRVASIRSELVAWRHAWSEAQNSKAKLDSSPDDERAHSEIGMFLCLFQNDWKSGLPYLAKGNDSAVREAAKLDLANPTTPGDMVSAGDAWYAIAKAEKGDPRYLERARFWYANSLSGLNRVGRLKPEARLSEAAPIARNQISFANSVGMTLKRIPAGEFTMGTDSRDVEIPFKGEPYVSNWVAKEQPPHPVRVSRAFYMATHETTVEQFEAFCSQSKYRTHAEIMGDQRSPSAEPRKTWRNTGFATSGDHPVVYVTWTDAVAFTDWLSAKEGLRYRLPTEAEWEYACRAESAGLYSFGNDPKDLGSFANCADASLLAKRPTWEDTTLATSDGHAETAPVGSFLSNAFGLYDMHGNVWEWCVDRVEEDYYARSPFYDPLAASRGAGRIYRGGGWDTRPFSCRSGSRSTSLPKSELKSVGFRVVCEAPFEGDSESAPLPAEAPLAEVEIDSREPLPSPDAIDAAEARLDEIYEKEFASARSAEDRIALAASLMEKVRDLNDDPVARFVVLRKARMLAIAASDRATAGSATEALTKNYQVDPLEARVNLLTELAETARTDPARRDLADEALAEAEVAVEAKRFDEVDRLVGIARDLATKVRNESYRNRIDAFARRAKTARDAFEAYQAAKAKLDAAPDDAEALRVCGYYLCLEDDDWAAGLPLLAKLPDPLLKTAAELDVADPTDAKGRLAAADAWHAFAEADDANAPFVARARDWYEIALDDLTGLDKLHAEKRVADIERRAAKPDPTVAAEPDERALVDVWDKGLIRGATGSQLMYGCDFVSMFGGSARSSSLDATTATFIPCKGGEIQFVEWELVRPMQVGKVRVRLRHQDGKEGDGAASAIRVYGFDPLDRKFELLFEFRPGYPYGASMSIPPIFPKKLSNAQELDFTARFDPVTSSAFRAEFVHYGESDERLDGVEVVELDAYAE